MASISVIIPNYNRASMVVETIQNMLNQSLIPKEIIVVDDGSTDNSVEVIASFGGIVRLIRQTNQGPGAARNAGLRAATGDFIQMMDSDDLASLNKLEIQVKALEKSGADFAYCSWVHCTINNKKIHFRDHILQAGPAPADKSLLEWFVSGWSLVFQNCLFRRSILDKAGTYRTDLMPSEDSEYFIRILLADAKAIFTPGCLVFYREHEQHKITSTGTSSIKRANDWTNYLTITGNLLNGRFRDMHFSTRIAAGTIIKAHLDYCKQHSLPILPVDHPYVKLVAAIPTPFIWLQGLIVRLRRKLLSSPDAHPAFKSKPVNNFYRQLAVEMQYQLV